MTRTRLSPLAPRATRSGLSRRQPRHPATSLRSGPTQSITSNSYIHSTNTLLRGPVEPAEYTSIDYTQVLDDHRVLASIGSVGDAYDNAPAESWLD